METNLITAQEAHNLTVQRTKPVEQIITKINTQIKWAIKNFGGFQTDIEIPLLYVDQIRDFLINEKGYNVEVFTSRVDRLYHTIEISIKW